MSDYKDNPDDMRIGLIGGDKSGGDSIFKTSFRFNLGPSLGALFMV